ncbi:MAG TPA: type II secretion system protein GspL [Steroidobacter sp.]|jgi:general secretion pathway protein L|nr:type II secretion system protein GspL [Steroidobacter sp.]
MAEVLVVRLSASAVPERPAAEWLVLDATGARRGNVHCGVLADAAPLAAGRKVVLLACGADTLLAEPVLPVKSGSKLAQVVPFALEEQLAADVENLHFAIGKREGRPGTPVAVVAKDCMDRWREMLQAVGLHADAFYAETAALPEAPNAVTLLIEGTRVYVKREASPGAVLEVEPLIEALQLALAAGEQAREHVTIYVSEDDYERERDLLEGLREFTASLQVKLLPEGPLPLFAATALRRPPVNLLQGPYAAKTKLRLSFAPWRYAAMLAAAFLTSHLGLKTWQYFHYTGEEARLNAQIIQVFQQAMPGAPMPDPAAARKLMESRLAQLRGASPDGGMMVALATVGEALAQMPDAKIEALSYRDNITDLRVLAPSVDALDRIRQIATQRGMSAELQSANPRESKFEGRLQLKSAGA